MRSKSYCRTEVARPKPEEAVGGLLVHLDCTECGVVDAKTSEIPFPDRSPNGLHIRRHSNGFVNCRGTFLDKYATNRDL
jgi:hypothetical protein